MQLDRPFTRLLVRFDPTRLQKELAVVPDDAWRPHPTGFAGNDALLLVSRNGDPDDDATGGEMRPTPILETLPYVRQVLAGLGTVIGRTRIMRIGPEAEASPHVDVAYYWWDRLRIHIPIATNDGVEFRCGDDVEHLAAGETWVFDTWRTHKVVNPGPAARAHLVIDTVGSDDLWELVARSQVDPGAAPRFVPYRPGADLGYPLESVNLPVVMSPWELDAKLHAALRDLARTEPDGSVELRQVLESHRREWRSAWAEHGDRPIGWPQFQTLRDRAARSILGYEGRFSHENGTDAVAAIRNLVLTPSVNPELAAPQATEPARPTTRTSAGPETKSPITSPVIVVCPPRSGSSLLFETLARSPDLFSIGGESHALFESLPELRPQERGWHSNALDADDATPAVRRQIHEAFLRGARDRSGMRPGRNRGVRLLEKTPKNALRVPFLASVFPDATFVYLYRDPRETISSMFDAWRSGKFVTYPDLPDWNGPDWSLVLTPGWRDLRNASLPEIVVDQWVRTTTALLDDLDSLPPGRWTVASYDRLVADPNAEIGRLCEHLGLAWDIDLGDELPHSRHTLESPHPDKWRANAEMLEPVWQPVREVAKRAHDIHADPPRVKPVQAGARASVSMQPAESPTAASLRSVHTDSLPGLLETLGVSVAVSTYQSGRVAVVRSHGGKVNANFRSFTAPMGMAHHNGLLAVGTSQGVWIFQDQPAVLHRMEPRGVHDACYMPRTQHVTGDTRIHDVVFSEGDLWIVNTRFSCLATLDGVHSFVPRWRPPFVSELAPEDRCHLNGVALIDGKIRVASALGVSDEAGGWRDGKADGGLLMEVPSGEPIATGLSMPHSPRVHGGKLWVLESGHGSLATVDLDTGDVETVTHLPGFTRGLAFAGPYAFVGLSQVREKDFGGLPLTEHLDERACGLWVVDTRTGDVAAFLRFEGDVQEVYDVQVLPHRYPEIAEPGADLASDSFILSDQALAEVPTDRRT